MSDISKKFETELRAMLASGDSNEAIQICLADKLARGQVEEEDVLATRVFVNADDELECYLRFLRGTGAA